MTMRNDATRQLIRPEDSRRLRRVVPRQGQLLLDADVSEDSRLALRRIETEASDSLGPRDRFLVPAGSGAFAISTAGGSVAIGKGYGYLDGRMIDNPDGTTLAGQPNPPQQTGVSTPAVVVLKTLERFVDPVEEPVYADRALGDAEAAGRALQDWQVYLLKLKAASSCEKVMQTSEWSAMAQPSTGTIGIAVATAPPASDPCSLLPTGGYTGLENQLYRIEVHDGKPQPGLPDADGPRFGLKGLRLKLSRRNASILVEITGISGVEFTVAPPARDARNWFVPGQYAEIVAPHDDIDPSAALAAERLFPVASATDDKVVLAATAAEIGATNVVAGGGWYLRLWDRLPDGKGWIEVGAPGAGGLAPTVDIGNGLSVIAGGGTGAVFRRGEYWTFAARADGTVDWPAGAQQESPHGPVTLYAPLAVIGSTAPGADPEDCRIPFATLSDRSLYYRGGDGQSVFPPASGGHQLLPSKLRLAVLRGKSPVPGARVVWDTPAGAVPGRIDGAALAGGNTHETFTGLDGTIAVDWEIDTDKPDGPHRVRATLDPPDDAGHAVVFTAGVDAAALTGFATGPDTCTDLENIDNVQAAIDILCHKLDALRKQIDPPTLRLKAIRLSGGQGDVDLIDNNLILNGLKTPFDVFTKAIVFETDGKTALLSRIESLDPVVEVEIDLVYPPTMQEKQYWYDDRFSPMITGPFGFQKLRLAGSVRFEKPDNDNNRGAAIRWTPSKQAVLFLNGAKSHWFGQIDDRVREPAFKEIVCRLRLRAAHIWIQDEKDRVYLNAEHLGVAGAVTGRELLSAKRDRDPQAAADLDMYFFLTKFA